MCFTKQGHEHFESCGFEVFTLKFNPVNKMYILESIKGTFDDFLGRDILIISKSLAGPLSIYAGLWGWITHHTYMEVLSLTPAQQQQL
jgi:hypothetical protein